MSRSASADDADALGGLLHRRFSCRAFLPQPVPRPVIERILALAQRTASWCNTQPWRVHVTSGAGTERLRERLYRHAASGAEPLSDLPWPREFRGVQLDRRRRSGFGLYEALGIGRGDMAARTQQGLENFRLFGAPHVAVITSDEALGVYGAVDCGGYVANFLLAAEACGVSACPQAALAHHCDVLREELGVPADRVIVCGISFGYADPAHPANRFRTERAALDEAIDWVDG